MKTIKDIFPTYEDFKSYSTLKGINSKLVKSGISRKELSICKDLDSDTTYVCIYNIVYEKTFKFGSKELYDFLTGAQFLALNLGCEYLQVVCNNRVHPTFRESGLFYNNGVKSRPVVGITTADIEKYKNMLVELCDKPATIKNLLAEYTKYKPDTILKLSSLKLSKNVLTIKETGVPEIQVDTKTGRRIRS